MREECLSLSDTMRRFNINFLGIVKRWEQVYLEEGQKIWQKNAEQPAKLSKKVVEGLITENQQLCAENVYLKKFASLSLEEERRQLRNRW